MILLSYIIPLVLVGVYAYYSNRIQKLEWKRVTCSILALPVFTFAFILLLALVHVIIGTNHDTIKQMIENSSWPGPGTPILQCLLQALSAAITEEPYKFAILWFVIWLKLPNADKTEKMRAHLRTDVMLLSICVAESFSIMENLMYSRISSILFGHLGHAFYGLVMGYLLYRWRTCKKEVSQIGILLLALVVPFVLHFLWDGIVFVMRSDKGNYGIFLLLVLYVLMEWWIVVKLLRRHYCRMKADNVSMTDAFYK